MSDILVEPLARTSTEAHLSKIEAAAATQQGQERSVNEDSVFHATVQAENGQWRGLYVVCDGLGGHAGGEVASRLAIETVANHLAGLYAADDGGSAPRTRPTGAAVDEHIRAAVERANSRIRSYARSHPDGPRNLGTTLTLALLDGETAHIANVGDSRTYAARDNAVTQLTEDHSLAAKLTEAGIVQDTPQEPVQRNIIYRALGTDDGVEVDLFHWHLRPGDKLVLCTDGLWQAFPENAELARWLGPATAPHDLSLQLVTEAHRRDGADDTSAVVVAAF